MADEVYEQLRQQLDKHPSGAPETPDLMEILVEYFTPDEARVASVAPFLPKSAAEIGAKAGVGEEDASRLLESMADKGLVFAREKDGVWGYALLPIMPGIFEFPYMKAEKTDTLARLGEVWSRYLKTHATEMDQSKATFARVVPIQEEVEGEAVVLTYEKVYDLIDKASVVGLANCACRNAFANCDGPLEACMVFEETCTYLVERGFARYITKDEMKKLLREFDELGLVHNVNNSQDKLQFVCNCCSCCCGFLRTVRELELPGFLASSGFLAECDEGLCAGCAVCEDRCPMDAIEIVDDVAVVDEPRCIGCALCVTGCETDAMRLKRRDEVPVVPESMRAMGVEVLNRRGRLGDFLDAMK